jgi:hypothetical protein
MLMTEERMGMVRMNGRWCSLVRDFRVRLMDG